MFALRRVRCSLRSFRIEGQFYWFLLFRITTETISLLRHLPLGQQMLLEVLPPSLTHTEHFEMTVLSDYEK